jgi:hypothetical protein
MNTPLTQYPQRGKLLHIVGGKTYTQTEGWFSLTNDGRTVIRRKIGGRNVSAFTMVKNVVEFEKQGERK